MFMSDVRPIVMHLNSLHRMQSSTKKRIFSELVNLGLHVVFTDLPKLLVQCWGDFIRTEIFYCLQQKQQHEVVFSSFPKDKCSCCGYGSYSDPLTFSTSSFSEASGSSSERQPQISILDIFGTEIPHEH